MADEGFTLPIIPAQIPQMPVVITPADLEPLLEKLHQAGIEGQVEAQNTMNRQIVGTSGAEATKAKNEASTATSRQDIIDQQGIQPKQSIVARIFGGGTPKASAQPAPAASSSAPQKSGLQHLSTEELMKIAGGGGYTFGQ